MLYRYPQGTRAVVIADYERPYEDPISFRAGDLVVPAPERAKQTDILGWDWCRGPDGREGWAPTTWMEQGDDGWRAKRDFSALELTVRRGEGVVLHLSESGFVLCEAGDEVGWLKDAVLSLVDEDVGPG